VLTRWDSLDAIRPFAGDRLEMANVPPAAQALLARFDETVSLAWNERLGLAHELPRAGPCPRGGNHVSVQLLESRVDHVRRSHQGFGSSARRMRA